MPDSTTEHLVRDALTAFDADPEDEQRSYIDCLRRFQGVLIDAVALGAEPPTPDGEQAIRQLVGRLDPRPQDLELAIGSLLRRAQIIVDGELFKWTSGLVQPPGPSGATAVAACDPTSLEDEHA